MREKQITMCLTVMAAVFAPFAAVAQQGAAPAASMNGRPGQRETRDQSVIGLEPTARIDSRIQNRVQSRMRNRIDRYYDPQANANSPFSVASDQARAAGQPRRR